MKRVLVCILSGIGGIVGLHAQRPADVQMELAANTSMASPATLQIPRFTHTINSQAHTATSPFPPGVAARSAALPVLLTDLVGGAQHVKLSGNQRVRVAIVNTELVAAAGAPGTTMAGVAAPGAVASTSNPAGWPSTIGTRVGTSRDAVVRTALTTALWAAGQDVGASFVSGATVPVASPADGATVGAALARRRRGRSPVGAGMAPASALTPGAAVNATTAHLTVTDAISAKRVAFVRIV